MDLLLTSPSDWQYFAKGNANALFEYTGPNDTFKGQLLRLRLEKELDLYVSVEKLNNFIQKTCEPLFPGQLVGTQMINVPPEFRDQLTVTKCKLMNSETHGFLMMNIRKGNFENYKLLKYCSLHVETKGSETKEGKETRATEDEESKILSVLFELKPKWLYDPSTIYCRTCLLKQLKGLDRHFCCNDLTRAETIDRGVMDVISAIPIKLIEKIEQSRFPLSHLLTMFAQRPQNILHKLKKNEIVGEGDEILSLNSASDVLDRLSLVMTLRDVGLFLKFKVVDKEDYKQPIGGDAFLTEINGEIYETTSYIYDLDLKSSERFEHWKATEMELQGYYNCESDWPPCSI